MPAKIFSAALVGITAQPIEVEADISQGLPQFRIVGLPDTAVQEARERVRAALRNADFSFPRTRLTINMAPADVRKEGPGFDLPIAVAVLEAGGVIPKPEALKAQSLFVGELALNGTVRPVSGVLAIALMAAQYGFSVLFVPTSNVAEATLARGVTIIPVNNLRSLVEHLTGKTLIAPARGVITDGKCRRETEHDFAHIHGQAHAKRALEIAAAGGHNVLMTGPPGSGKTLLARSLPSILPELTLPESLEVTQIHSIVGAIPPGTTLIRQRPFRAPHHTTSHVALVGGGSTPRPGEITLAHRGILFLDEFPEFSRSSIEALRQPLEDGVVTVSRASGTSRFPAKFMLVAARNPCPCGYATDDDHLCTCTLGARERYQKKISGPMLDRVDVHINVPRLPVKDLAVEVAAEPSCTIRARVARARARQSERFMEMGIYTNCEMGSRDVKQFCQLGQDEHAFLFSAAEKLKLSARAWSRVLKLSRTIADLAVDERIGITHIAEALQYRPQRE